MHYDVPLRLAWKLQSVCSHAFICTWSNFLAQILLLLGHGVPGGGSCGGLCRPSPVATGVQHRQRRGPLYFSVPHTSEFTHTYNTGLLFRNVS
jgi:hypothetical protein